MINLGPHPNLVNLVDANKTVVTVGKVDKESSQNGNKCVQKVKEEVNYLVLEKCNNGSLSKYVKTTGPFEEMIARFLFTQLCSAIHFMHSNEYVHLDIKLDNILCDEFFNLKVADLGIALCAKGTSQLLAHKRGTNRYMAPEVANATASRPYNVFPADIYSAGVCLSLMLLGTYPSPEEETIYSTESSCEEGNLNDSFKVCSVSDSYLSEDCKDLLQRLVHPDPSQRPDIYEIGEHPWMTQEFPENIGEMVYSEMSERLSYLKSLVEESSTSLSIDME